MQLFSAKWCGPCNVLKAKLAAAGLDNQGLYESIDIDTNIEKAKAAGVRGIPALVVDGQLVSGSEKIFETIKAASTTEA